MKKTAKIITTTLLLLFVASALACGKKTASEPAAAVATTPAKAEDLYGTWKGTGHEISTVSFAKTGAYRDDAGDGLYVSGTYTVDEASQTITVNEEEYGMTFVYDFTVDGNKLTLQMNGGNLRTFVKQ